MINLRKFKEEYNEILYFIINRLSKEDSELYPLLKD